MNSTTLMTRETPRVVARADDERSGITPRISTNSLIKSRLQRLTPERGSRRVQGELNRAIPAPKRNRGGMLIGNRPVIGAAPVSARAAAVCDTGNPPHATM